MDAATEPLPWRERTEPSRPSRGQRAAHGNRNRCKSKVPDMCYRASLMPHTPVLTMDLTAHGAGVKTASKGSVSRQAVSGDMSFNREGTCSLQGACFQQC